MFTRFTICSHTKKSLRFSIKSWKEFPSTFALLFFILSPTHQSYTHFLWDYMARAAVPCSNGYEVVGAERQQEKMVKFQLSTRAARTKKTQHKRILRKRELYLLFDDSSTLEWHVNVAYFFWVEEKTREFPCCCQRRLAYMFNFNILCRHCSLVSPRPSDNIERLTTIWLEEVIES